MSRERVAVAMSGGVDSSVAAALLIGRGFDVIGLTMVVSPIVEPSGRGVEPETISAAASNAAALGIPHHTVDFRERFERGVIDAFCRDYARGRTPNPCVLCNAAVKFGWLRDAAASLGADRLATGHHARAGFDAQRARTVLRAGRDRGKDQSYFLYGIAPEALPCILFPVGELTKAEVVAAAARRGLPAARRPESQEICFIPDDDYARFLEPRVPQAFEPGPIVSLGGRRLGRHGGIARFTVGQRGGLGVSAAQPLYVVRIEADTRTVVVGEAADVWSKALRASRARWLSIDPPGGPFEAAAKIRARHEAAAARIIPLGGDEVRVEFGRPQRAIAPGQAVVFYDGDVVLGGATIEAAI